MVLSEDVIGEDDGLCLMGVGSKEESVLGVLTADAVEDVVVGGSGCVGLEDGVEAVGVVAARGFHAVVFGECLHDGPCLVGSVEGELLGLVGEGGRAEGALKTPQGLPGDFEGSARDDGTLNGMGCQTVASGEVLVDLKNVENQMVNLLK